MDESYFVLENQEVILFISIEELWFWCCKGQLVRESGDKFLKKNQITIRPCSIDDIFKILVRLRFSGKFSKKEVEVLKKYGKKFCPPDFYKFTEREDCLLWEKSLKKLEIECKKKEFIE